MRTAVIVLCGLALGTPLLAAAALSAPDSSASGGGVADIPPDYLQDYRTAAQRFGLDWAVLAAIGKLECDHGRLDAAGCNPRNSVNKAGAAGPMQFLATTWRRGAQARHITAAWPRHAGNLGWVRERRGRRRHRGHLGPCRCDHGRRSLPRRQRRAGRLPARALRVQPRRLVRRARAATGRRLPRRREHDRSRGRPGDGEEDPVGYAARYLGSPYVYGGNHADLEVELDPASAPVLQVSARDGRVGFFDCSSLASWAFAKTRGVFIGGTSEQQWRLAQERSLAGQALVRIDAPPGGFARNDLLFFEPAPGGPGHVAIAIDQTRMIDSPHTGANVRITLISSHTDLVGVARYPKPATPPSVTPTGP